MPRSDGDGSWWDHPDPFVIELAATGDDIDSYGHVNNTVYLRWLERCAWAHSEAGGLPEAECLAMQRGMAVRSVRLEYLAAAHADDRVRVGNWICESDGRIRVTRRFQIRRVDDDRTVLRGEMDYVCLNLANRPPLPSAG